MAVFEVIYFSDFYALVLGAYRLPAKILRTIVYE